MNKAQLLGWNMCLDKLRRCFEVRIKLFRILLASRSKFCGNVIVVGSPVFVWGKICGALVWNKPISVSRQRFMGLIHIHTHKKHD